MSAQPDILVKGAIVWVDFDPVMGSEQAGRRPAVVVSGNRYNTSIPNIVIVAPVTSRDRGFPHHVRVDGGGAKLARGSYAMTEQVRAIDRRRIARVAGVVSSEAMRQIDRYLADFLDLRV